MEASVDGKREVGAVSVRLTLRRLVLGGLALAACAAPAAEPSPPPSAVTLMLDWVPNTNHTGIFVAQAEGDFEQRGLGGAALRLLRKPLRGTDPAGVDGVRRCRFRAVGGRGYRILRPIGPVGCGPDRPGLGLSGLAGRSGRAAGHTAPYGHAAGLVRLRPRHPHP